MNSNPCVKLIILILLFTNCSEVAYLFEEIPSEKSNLNFVNSVMDSTRLSILDYMYFYNGGGVAIGDVNNDGLLDVYFTGNKSANKLYLNQGGLSFKDITKEAKVAGKSSWNTGVSMVDINNDGWLDIYVCAVVGINGFKGHNELFINQKDGTFIEESIQYGLDIKNYSTASAFFDFDLDGDLDLYLLNHGIHKTNNFGKSQIKNERNELSSDKLFENRNGFFYDVSKKANLNLNGIGYGLAVSVGDLNNDGWDDLYISNDFYEDDYLYINQKNGTFKDESKNQLSQTSQFSMGNDVFDINNDGFLDIITLDMLPKDEKTLKKSIGELTTSNLTLKRTLGYQDQFPRNHLHINTGKNKFLETALYSNIEATDWSWAPLFGDYDLDGYIDLFITNGIFRRPNDADFIKFISSDEIKNKINTTHLVDQQALDYMPSGKVSNYFFQGTHSLRFNDRSNQWFKTKPSLSNGAAIGDLDNDGDLDIITNNVNQEVSLLENKSNQRDVNYLKLKFKGSLKNKQGIGIKAHVYSGGKTQFQQLHLNRGFQSSLPPEMVFGLGGDKIIDSILIIWPDQKFEKRKGIPSNQTLFFDYQHAELKKELNQNLTIIHPFEENKNNWEHIHWEKVYPEFNREKLIPYGITNEGPGIAVGDINSDGEEDIFIGGSKGYPSQLFLNIEGTLKEVETPDFLADSKFEDVDAIFTDIDLDDDLDLIVISGGGEYISPSPMQMDRLYLNDGKGNFKRNKSLIPKYYHNGSIIISSDIDGDGDSDFFIGSRSVTNDFGILPDSYLLLNQSEGFQLAQQSTFNSLGMITDALFYDYDQDQDDDLLVVSEWSEIKLFKNDNGKFNETTSDVFLKNPKGLWQTIHPYDVDMDGDKDFLVGNIGLNTKFKASVSHPLKMYINDFDNNGKKETLVAVAKEDNYYTIDSKDKLASQMETFIRKKFKNYHGFAGKTIEEIFGDKILKSSICRTVEELRSGYLRNDNGYYSFVPLPDEFQWGPIRHFFLIHGINKLIISGAKDDLPPYQGKWMSQKNFLFESLTNYTPLHSNGIDILNKKVVNIEQIILNGKLNLIFFFQNEPSIIYQVKN